MIVLDGRSALSDFRLDRLNLRLGAIARGIRVRGARQVYFVESKSQLSPTLHRRLAEVLDATEAPPADASLWVVPRLGTLSPWSSKATDIVHHVGIHVSRVERGTAFLIENLPGPDDPAFAAVANALHDPMTQSVLLKLSDAGQIFLRGESAPLSASRLATMRVPPCKAPTAHWDWRSPRTRSITSSTITRGSAATRPTRNW